MPYGITQFYLPPDRGDVLLAIIPAKAGTQRDERPSWPEQSDAANILLKDIPRWSLPRGGARTQGRPENNRRTENEREKEVWMTDANLFAKFWNLVNQHCCHVFQLKFFARFQQCLAGTRDNASSQDLNSVTGATNVGCGDNCNWRQTDRQPDKWMADDQPIRKKDS